MQGLHIDGWFRLGLQGFTQHPGRPLKQLVSPLLDLVGMDVELLRQLDHGLLALDRGYRHFRLESRAVVLARSSCNGLLLARRIMLLTRREIDPLDQFLARLIRGKSTYPSCSDFRSHLCRPERPRSEHARWAADKGCP